MEERKMYICEVRSPKKDEQFLDIELNGVLNNKNTVVKTAYASHQYSLLPTVIAELPSGDYDIAIQRLTYELKHEEEEKSNGDKYTKNVCDRNISQLQSAISILKTLSEGK